MDKEPTITLFKEHDVPRIQNDISSNIISGEPVQHSELKFNGQNGKVRSGIWESTAGVFKAEYNGIIEFCHVLEGGATIKTSNGKEFIVTAGDGFILDAGLKTEWTVSTFIKKHFMICEV